MAKESKLSIYGAIIANILIAASKFVASAITGQLCDACRGNTFHY